MAEHLPLSHDTQGTFSMSGPDNKMYVKVPDVHRNYVGKRNVASPWMVSDSKAIDGEFHYANIGYLSGAATATAEIVVRKLVVEFRSLKRDEDREVVVAVFKSHGDVEAMVTTIADGNWEST